MHALFSVALTQPELLARHLAGYGELAAAEVDEMMVGVRRRTLVSATMLFLLTVSLTLVGVSILVWPLYASQGVVPVAWLMAVPLAPGLGALGCALWLRQQQRQRAFGLLREQLAQDAQWLDLQDTRPSVKETAHGG
jgi:uncharacterized membrane protein YqjE